MSFTIPRFRSVLITAMSLLTLLIISIVSWLFTVQYEKEAIKHLSHYAHTVAANIASAEVENIITENYASLQGSIFSFLQGAHIESITIASPTGIIIADTQPERLGDSLFVPDEKRLPGNLEKSQVDFETSIAEIHIPIQIGETLIGWCFVQLEIDYIKDHISMIQKNTAILAGIALLVNSLLLFFFSMVITRPLENMMQTAARVADGDLDQQTKIAGVYEIRKLAEVFNYMTLAIKKRETRLRQVQKMEAIGTLSSSIAHEFGNPLVGINLFLNGLKSGGYGI